MYNVKCVRHATLYIVHYTLYIVHCHYITILKSYFFGTRSRIVLTNVQYFSTLGM